MTLSASAVAANFENFQPYVQPIINVATGEIQSYEVLTRCADVVDVEKFFRELSPMRGAKLSILMLTQTMSAFQQRPIPLQFNLSARQLLHPDTIKLIQTTLEGSSYPQGYLTCELVEYDGESNDNLCSVMNSMGSLGLKFSLDDFGTGINAYERLLELPISQVKVGRFIANSICHCKKNQLIAKHLVDLSVLCGHSDIVFEGVETIEQANIIRRLESTNKLLLQGYVLKKPHPLSCVDLNNTQQFASEKLSLSA